MRKRRSLSRYGRIGLVMTIAVLSLMAVCAKPVLGASKPELPKVIRVGSNPPGMITAVWTAAIADTLTRHTPFRYKVETYASSSVYRDLLNQGQLDLALNSAPEIYKSYRGLEQKTFTPTPHLRMIHYGAPFYFGMVVRADSGIRTVADLKGKRVCGMYRAQISRYMISCGQLEADGLSWDDVKVVPASNVNEGLGLLGEGRVDAAGAALGAAKVRETNSAVRGGIRWITQKDTSDSALSKMRKFVPASEFVTISEGVGVLEPTVFVSYRMNLVTNKDANEEAVYLITKAMWENVEDLHRIHRTLKTMTREAAVTKVAIVPYHPGAIRFYEEKGVWAPEMKALQEQLLEKGYKK